MSPNSNSSSEPADFVVVVVVVDGVGIVVVGGVFADRSVWRSDL